MNIAIWHIINDQCLIIQDDVIPVWNPEEKWILNWNDNFFKLSSLDPSVTHWDDRKIGTGMTREEALE